MTATVSYGAGEATGGILGEGDIHPLILSKDPVPAMGFLEFASAILVGHSSLMQGIGSCGEGQCQAQAPPRLGSLPVPPSPTQESLPHLSAHWCLPVHHQALRPRLWW